MEGRLALPEYMNAQALAVHIGVTERTVRRWIKEGDLPAVKQGRSYLIRRENAEKMRLGELGQVVDERAALAERVSALERELAVLQGRYAEVHERNRDLEDVLHQERRRAALAEARLELAANVAPLPAAA
jgi:excisionase family DNA binding protein